MGMLEVSVCYDGTHGGYGFADHLQYIVHEAAI